MKPFHVVSISLIPDQATVVISVEKCQRTHSSFQWKLLARGFHGEAQGSRQNRSISRWYGPSPPCRGRWLAVPFYSNLGITSPHNRHPCQRPYVLSSPFSSLPPWPWHGDLPFHALSSHWLTSKATVEETVFSLLLLELKNKLLNRPFCILTLEFGSLLRKITFHSKWLQSLITIWPTCRARIWVSGESIFVLLLNGG